MTKTFKVLSAMLSYPTEELQAAAPEFAGILEQEGLVPAMDRQVLSPLLQELAGQSIYELQERYVLLFDRTRSLSLHLFEHIHGESRDRGQAMVDLAAHYEQQGLTISVRELPDYLPLFLEFLSTLPSNEACDLLEQPLHIVSALATRLQRRDSVYAAAVRALEALARTKPETAAVQSMLDESEDDPNDLAALDAIWEETEVVFGPGAQGDDNCPRVSDILNRMAANPAGTGQAGQPDVNGS